MLTKQGFALSDLPMPRPVRGQVLVRSVSCGVCEGDVWAYRSAGKMTGPGRLIGHEGSGIVEALGPGARGLAVGDAVTAMGGPYAEYFLAAPKDLAKLPAKVDPLWALGEPVACVMHAARRFGVRRGDRVAIVGTGFMGLMCMQLARLQGAGEIVAIEPLAWRRRVAAKLGADATANPQGQDPAKLAKRLGEFQVVIEAAGAPEAVDLCTELVAQHGRIVLVGYHQSHGGIRQVNMKMWNYKAIDIANGHVRRIDEKLQAMRAGVALLAKGKLDVRPLVTWYPLSRIAQAFADLVARRRGLFKAVLVPQDRSTKQRRLWSPG